MMARLSIPLLAIFVFFGWLLPVAWGTCTQNDLQGKWNAKIWREGFVRGESHWNECKVLIGPGGVIKKGAFTNGRGRTVRIVGGKLIVSDGCHIEGTIETRFRTFYIDRGSFVKDELVLGGVSETRWKRLQLLRAWLKKWRDVEP